MLWVFAVLIPVFCGVGAVSEELERVLNQIQEVGIGCAGKENAEPDDLVDLTEGHYPPSSHAAKCILACLFENYKILQPDGTLNKQEAIEFFKMFETVAPELFSKQMQAADICYENPNIFEDRCETASDISTCVMDQLRKLGVTKDQYSR